MKLVLICLVLLFWGCDGKYTQQTQEEHEQLKKEYPNILLKRLPIVCNEFGVAYYINSSGQHTSYMPVFKSSTEVAMCKDLNLK